MDTQERTRLCAAFALVCAMRLRARADAHPFPSVCNHRLRFWASSVAAGSTATENSPAGRERQQQTLLQGQTGR